MIRVVDSGVTDDCATGVPENGRQSVDHMIIDQLKINLQREWSQRTVTNITVSLADIKMNKKSHIYNYIPIKIRI